CADPSDPSAKPQAAAVELHFSVRDSGVGIPPDKQQVIFDPFTQADGSATRRFGGTGLGLAISARLATLMSGRLWAESEPGRGSTFHFTAQVQIGSVNREGREGGSLAPPLVSRPMPHAGRMLRILLAEDNTVNQQVASSLLQRQGHRVRVVDNGRQALQA